VPALGAAAQDCSVAGLEAQRSGIGRHVGATLEDDADDAQWHPHALDAQPVRPVPLGRDRADGIGERCDLNQTRAHRLDAPLIEPQTIEQRGAEVLGLRVLHVQAVGLQDRRMPLAQHLGGGLERDVLLSRARERQRARCGDCRPAQAMHQRIDVLARARCVGDGAHDSTPIFSARFSR
jgi:hypothetical protein